MGTDHRSGQRLTLPTRFNNIFRVHFAVVRRGGSDGGTVVTGTAKSSAAAAAADQPSPGQLQVAATAAASVVRDRWRDVVGRPAHRPGLRRGPSGGRRCRYRYSGRGRPERNRGPGTVATATATATGAAAAAFARPKVQGAAADQVRFRAAGWRRPAELRDDDARHDHVS